MIACKGKKRRFAGATVEMAVVTPLLLTMLFGIIEYGWIYTVRQALTTAAREGARTASLPGSEDEDIVARIADFMNPIGLAEAQYTVELTRADEQAGIDTETVHITVPYEEVTIIGAYFGSTDFDLGATCSMRKEGVD